MARKRQMNFTKMLVTPQKARQWLKNNKASPTSEAGTSPNDCDLMTDICAKCLMTPLTCPVLNGEEAECVLEVGYEQALRSERARQERVYKPYRLVCMWCQIDFMFHVLETKGRCSFYCSDECRDAEPTDWDGREDYWGKIE